MRQAFNEQSVEEICQHYRGLFDQRRLQAQLLCLPNLRPTTSAPEANVEFHDIVAAVGESQMNAMIPDVMQLLTFYSVCPPSTAKLNAASVTCGASKVPTGTQHYVAAEARLTDAALRLPRDNSPEEASPGWLGLQGLQTVNVLW